MIIMKTFIFLCCTIVFSLAPNNIVSQNTKIKVNEDTTLTVDEVFKLIMNQTDYRFIYEKGIFTDFPKVQIKKGTVKVNKLLKRSLSQENLEIIVTDNNAILIKEKPTDINLEKLQQIEISGTVVDQNGQPLPGANILEKGTANGTQTDLEGNFSLNVAEENTILVVSYIGFATQEVSMNGQSQITITLQEDAAGLDEVVIVGYGSKKKVELTSAVSTVNGEFLESRPITNTGQALQGAQGIFVNQASGQPGRDGVSVVIRGQNSYATDSNPLVLVDGIEFPLSDVNPDDIESISILKDAAAASIYGSRASNGVILVTTKRGSKNKKLAVSYRNYFGFQDVIFAPELLSNSVQHMELYNQARLNSGVGIQYDDDLINEWRANEGTNDFIYPNTDWLDVFYQTGFVQNHTLNFSGGTEKASYSATLGYQNQTGVFYDNSTSAKRYTFGLNYDADITDRLKLGASFRGSIRDLSEASSNTCRIYQWTRVRKLAIVQGLTSSCSIYFRRAIWYYMAECSERPGI